MTVKEIEVEVTDVQEVHVCNNCGKEADWHVFSDDLAFCEDCAEHQFGIDLGVIPLDYSYDTSTYRPTKKWYRVRTEHMLAYRKGIFIYTIALFIVLGSAWIEHGASVWMYIMCALIAFNCVYLYVTRNYSERFEFDEKSMVELSSDKD